MSKYFSSFNKSLIFFPIGLILSTNNSDNIEGIWLIKKFRSYSSIHKLNGEPQKYKIALIKDNYSYKGYLIDSKEFLYGWKDGDLKIEFETFSDAEGFFGKLYYSDFKEGEFEAVSNPSPFNGFSFGGPCLHEMLKIFPKENENENDIKENIIETPKSKVIEI